MVMTNGKKQSQKEKQPAYRPNQRRRACLDTSAAREVRRFIRDFIKNQEAPSGD